MILKQNIFIELNVLQRARLLDYTLDSNLQVLKLDTNIHNEVRNRIDQIQRKFYLNEQLRVIQEELGDSLEDEIQTYKDKIEALELSSDIYKRVHQELNRLG